MQRKTSQLILDRLELIKAHADGKPIQQKLVNNTNSCWTTTETPSLLDPVWEFRIAPKTITLVKPKEYPALVWVEYVHGFHTDVDKHPEFYNFMYVEEKV